MNDKIGADQPVTPLAVRDAIVECFNDAHCLDAGIDGDKDLNEQYCRSVVEKAFNDVDGDFNKPTKEVILKVVNGLADFSKNFRNQEVIEKHRNKIMELVERLN